MECVLRKVFKKDGYYFDTGSYFKDLSVNNRPHPFDDLNRVCVNLQGGLGNQLFQIYTLINYSINNQVDFFINRFKNDEHRIINKIELKRPTYWDNIFSDLSGYLLNVSNKILHTYPFKIKDSPLSFQPLPFFNNRQSIWVLDGFFQSELYFRENKEIIFQKLHLTTQRENIARRYSHLFQRKTISIHFRYGDYTITPLYTLLDIDYYVNSLLLLKKELEKRDENFKDYNILYFYDIQDKEIVSGHINFLKDVFDISFTDINSLKLYDWEQLLLMSKCTHHVIANSSFSWWGAYLNENNSKIVTYPEIWLNNNSINKDLIPSQWNMITMKINVINIFYINLKHRLDRKRSIETQLKNLKSFIQNFLFSYTRIEMSIIIMELLDVDSRIF